MKWVKYLQRTPLAQIRADWSAFMDLRRQCVALRAKRSVAYDHIDVLIDGLQDNVSQPACVIHQYFIANSMNSRNGDGISDNAIYIRRIVCEKFNKTGGNIKCAKSGCPCVERNHAYVDACERYDLVRRAYRDFWRVRFAKAAQNVK